MNTQRKVIEQEGARKVHRREAESRLGKAVRLSHQDDALITALVGIGYALLALSATEDDLEQRTS
jgi:hypothetical protein